ADALLILQLAQLVQRVTGGQLLAGSYQLPAATGHGVQAPAERGDRAVAEADQVQQVQGQPHQPTDEAGDLGLVDLHHRVEAGDDRHGALVEVVEWGASFRAGAVLDLVDDGLRSVLTTLHSDLG